MNNKYHPIDCSFHDQLLAFATKKELVMVTYLDDNTQTSVNDVIIIDVYTKKGEEFMKLSAGQTIRLDHIIRVNDHELPGNPSCNI